MSTLISSAVGGKKAAAPKGAVRRRQPPAPGAPAKDATPVAVSSAHTSIAPPSPPRTQLPIPTTPASPNEPRAPSQPADTHPTTISTPSKPVEQSTRESSSPRRSHGLHTTTTPVENDQFPVQPEEVPSEPAPSQKRKRGAAPGKETTQPAKRVKASKTTTHAQVEHPAAQNEETTLDGGPSEKRNRDPPSTQEIIQPGKRVKRSSTRSNDKIQTAVREEQEKAPTAPSAAEASSRNSVRATRNKAQKTSAPAASAPQEAPSEKTQRTRGATATIQKTQAKKQGTSIAQKAQTKSTETSIIQDAPLKRKDKISSRKAQSKRKAAPESASTAVNSVTNDEGLTVEQQENVKKTVAKPKRRYRKKIQPAEQEASTEGVEGGQEEQAEHDDESDPELHEIDPNTVTMYEIGGDKRHGKTSEREKKMAEIDWDEVARKRREAAENIIAGQVQPVSGVVETTEGPSGTAESREAPPASPLMQFTVNPEGQIVEDEQSLRIDRRKQAEQEAAAADPIEEEIDLTKRINRTTYLNSRRREPAERVPVSKAKSDRWSDEDTERFYSALQMFGTDFMTISKMFAPKTRRMVKTKFNREERLDPKRIYNALVGKKTEPMDLEHYAREVGRDVSEYTKFTSMEEAESAIAREMEPRRQELKQALNAERQVQADMQNEENTRTAESSGRKKRVTKSKDPNAPKKTAAKRKSKKGAEAASGGDGVEVQQNTVDFAVAVEIE